ncbi:MAG TPA: winged helix-turn-helix domain-containing protein [Pirellulales bacterium]|nr:winged helix-turn-helix domain-containing protein [Pirellulales bacterium]
MATVSVVCDFQQIGETAGVIWRLLDERGPLSMAQVVKQSGEPRDLVMLALGWLAREDKIAIDGESRGRTVSLRE